MNSLFDINDNHYYLKVGGMQTSPDEIVRANQKVKRAWRGREAC
jgi:hypothetical protein